MEDIFYIGKFPPPYGGATIKNEILFNAISKHKKVIRFSTSLLDKRLYALPVFIKLLLFLIRNKGKKGIVCIASYSLFKLTRALRGIDKRMLNNISVFIVGGAFNQHMVNANQSIEVFNQYKNIYVESQRMKTELNKLGLVNVEVIPNCRPKPESRELFQTQNGHAVRCIFISRICEEKGISKIIAAAKGLNNKKIAYEIDFFGPVDGDVENYFWDEIKANANLKYKGVFETNKYNIYDMIKKYDILLFPTQAENEGIPGIIVEAKIAGIPVVANNWNNNEGIINHLADGLILESNTPEALCEAIEKLDCDRSLLNKLREKSFLSGEKYFIENYMQFIIDRV